MENFLIRMLPREIWRKAPLVNPEAALLESAKPLPESMFFAFYFSGLPWLDGQRLLRLAAMRAKCLYVADFSIAERNLELAPHLLARLLFASRREFWRKGGIGNFVLQSGLERLDSRPIMGRMALLVSLGAFCD